MESEQCLGHRCYCADGRTKHAPFYSIRVGHELRFIVCACVGMRCCRYKTSRTHTHKHLRTISEFLLHFTMFVGSYAKINWFRNEPKVGHHLLAHRTIICSKWIVKLHFRIFKAESKRCNATNRSDGDWMYVLIIIFDHEWVKWISRVVLPWNSPRSRMCFERNFRLTKRLAFQYSLRVTCETYANHDTDELAIFGSGKSIMMKIH